MRRRSSYHRDYLQRDVSTPSLAKLRASFLDLDMLRRRLLVRLSEDRRLYDPLGRYRRAGGLSRIAGTIRLKRAVVGVDRGSALRRDVLGFRIPEKVAICVRRKERREVLFAERKTKSGAGARRARNYYTGVSCDERRR